MRTRSVSASNGMTPMGTKCPPGQIWNKQKGECVPLTDGSGDPMGFRAGFPGQFGAPRTIRQRIQDAQAKAATPSPMDRLMAATLAPEPVLPPLPPNAPYDVCIEYPSGLFRFKDASNPEHGKHPMEVGYTGFDFVQDEGMMMACVSYGQEFEACFPVCQQLSGPQMLQPAPVSPRPQPRPTYVQPGPLDPRPTPQPRPTYVQPGPLDPRPGGGGGVPGIPGGGGGVPVTPVTPGGGGGVPGIPGDQPGDTPEDVFGDCCVEMIGELTGLLVCDNPMYDGMVVNTEGATDGMGNVLFYSPDKSWRAFLPLCEGTIEIIPDPSIPDGCCYDETTGLLYCPGHELHGAEVTIDSEAVMPTGQRIISVFIAELNWGARVPVCITQPSPDPGDEPVRPRPVEPCPPEHCYYDMSRIYDCYGGTGGCKT